MSEAPKPETQQKKGFSFTTFRRLLQFVHPYRKTLFLSITLSVLLAVVAIVRPKLIQYSVDTYIANRQMQALIQLTIIQFCILIGESLMRFWFLYRINWLGQTVVNDLRRTVFRKILHQDIAYYDHTPIGTLTTRTINDIEAINDVFSEGIISIGADILTIIAIITVMMVQDWRLTLMCLAPLPLLILSTYLFKEAVNKSFHKVRNAVAALNAFVQEHLTGMYLVQAFAAEKREQDRFDHINQQHRDANIRSIFAYAVFFAVVEVILSISIVLLMWYGAVRIFHHQGSPGVIIAFIMFLNLLFRPLRMMADKFNVLQMGMIAGERVFTVLDNEEYLHNNGTIAPAIIRGEVEFRQVHFSYKPGVPVLNGISFKLLAGKTMAIVGHTGAGKTSVISILNRQYDIQQGEIRIDGIPLNQYDIFALRRHIGIVLQDVFLLSGTIFDNITLRNKDIPMADVEKVCRMLDIHDFIMRLPGNYQFDIMERGNTLSQGQRQLLSFARVLLYNPSILVLDEATSSIDSESEMLIQKAIETLTRGRTSIIIAHRLSTIRKADEILVMERGNITERGDHESLLQQQGAYYDLYTAVEKSVMG